MDYKKDYYQLLEVPATASKEEIRAAYRRLAKLYHPDKNAGNAQAEEKFKLINEANEILSNDILRQEYDAYRQEQERWKKKQADKENDKDEIRSHNKKTYTKTNTVVTETKIYIKGIIRVKYWAGCEEKVAASYHTELDYKINPTEAVITIEEQDIYPVQGIPLHYLKAFKESDIFTVPIPQPIRCEVNGEAGKEYFELTLNDIRIKNIQLEGVTKHENNSYGTLTGQVYGYSPKLTYEEVEETVTECFGETGKTERKEENGFHYIRKEYYHPDCSTYWGNWIQLPKAGRPAGAYTHRPTQRVFVSTAPQPGCGVIAWGIALLSLLILSPKFFGFCLLLVALGVLLYNIETVFSSASRIVSFIGAGLLLLFLITAIRSFSGRENKYTPPKKKTASVKTTRGIRKPAHAKDSVTAVPDSLITHFLKWNDYAGQSYEGSVSVSLAALRNANTSHRQMSRGFYQDIGDVYKTMLNYDSTQLYYLYETFDSIKFTNNLDEVAFSQVLVSAIQSLPYFLVVDKSCDDSYSDAFTRNYLANCKTDCCIGNELFGVRSPAEFLSDLKGDCDTRSLLLYQVFRHYNYDVALLTSNYYRHAVIALAFSKPVDKPGLGITIGDKKYYMWETTSAGLDYGELPSSLNNLSYWDISLLNKKYSNETNP